MFQIQAPILVVPVAEAKLALGVHLRAAALAAYREITFAAKGLEIAHLQFVFRGLTLAVCSRVRRDGIVEIERPTFAEELLYRRADAAGRGCRPGEGRRGASCPAGTRALIFPPVPLEALRMGVKSAVDGDIATRRSTIRLQAFSSTFHRPAAWRYTPGSRRSGNASGAFSFHPL